MAAIKEPSVFSVSILFPSSFCFILSVLLVLFLTSSQAVAYYIYLQDVVYFRADKNNRKISMYSVEHESKWATEEFPADQVPTSLASLIHFLTRPLANSLQRGLSSTNRSRISPLARLYQLHSQESTVIMDFQDSNIESGIAFSVYGMDNEGRRLSFGFTTMHRHMLDTTNLSQHYNGVNEISNVPTFNIFSVMARGDVMRRIVRLIQNSNDNNISSYTLSIPDTYRSIYKIITTHLRKPPTAPVWCVVRT